MSSDYADDRQPEHDAPADDPIGAMELSRPRGLGVRTHLMMGLVLAATVMPTVLSTSHSTPGVL
ncbi:hypothetical protein ACFPM7_05510 [Actinokineospora guangxiensis]|uniref:Uncharacterized protein n=1 Tax=Actinokineospora guangxiensis TaxID=1490288 RepID=A0ABW0EK09_9PSEU